MEPVFATVHYQYPDGGANSGLCVAQEVNIAVLRAHFNPNYDQEVLSFLDTAKPGDYLNSSRGVIFRTR